MGKKRVIRSRREHPLTGLSLNFYIDPEKGDDVEGDGSEEKPVRTIRGLNQFFERLKRDDFEARRKKEREEEHRRLEEEAERKKKLEEDRKKREEERNARIHALDDQITLMQTELLILEKTFLESVYSQDMANIDLAYRRTEASYDLARIAAGEMHKLRLLIVARKVEHDRLVDERNKLGLSNWNHWAILGLGLVAAGYYFFSQMFKKEKT